MRSIAAKNGNSLPAGVSLALDGNEHHAGKPDEPSGSLVDVFRSPVTRTRMVLMAFIWLACGVGYYGLSLNVVNLSTNLYLSVFLNGIAEMPAFALTALMLEKFGRRAMLVSMMLLSGVSSVLGGLMSGLLHVHGSNPNSTMAMPSWVAGHMRGFLSGVQLACGVVGIFRMAGTNNIHIHMRAISNSSDECNAWDGE
jgi:OCT family organic cation transporter-like MFS transporter 4/5